MGEIMAAKPHRLFESWKGLWMAAKKKEEQERRKHYGENYGLGFRFGYRRSGGE